MRGAHAPRVHISVPAPKRLRQNKQRLKTRKNARSLVRVSRALPRKKSLRDYSADGDFPGLSFDRSNSRRIRRCRFLKKIDAFMRLSDFHDEARNNSIALVTCLPTRKLFLFP